MKYKLLALAIIALASGSVIAQHVPKLEVGPGDTYIVLADNTIYVDTLVMHDKATISFSPSQQGILNAKVAYVGKKCTISAKGTDGANGSKDEPGQNGEAGGSLTLQMHFEELGSLTIDTRGGKGGRGVNGKNGDWGQPDRQVKKVSQDANGKTITTIEIVPGTPGTNGTDATMGGNGGNGGNIMLMYSSSGFIINFNRDIHSNNINILHAAGNQGENGKPGKGGYMSSDGILLLSEFITGRNGKVELVNLSQPQF